MGTSKRVKQAKKFNTVMPKHAVLRLTMGAKKTSDWGEK